MGYLCMPADQRINLAGLPYALALLTEEMALRQDEQYLRGLPRPLHNRFILWMLPHLGQRHSTAFFPLGIAIPFHPKISDPSIL